MGLKCHRRQNRLHAGYIKLTCNGKNDWKYPRGDNRVKYKKKLSGGERHGKEKSHVSYLEVGPGKRHRDEPIRLKWHVKKHR